MSESWWSSARQWLFEIAARRRRVSVDERSPDAARRSSSASLPSLHAVPNAAHWERPRVHISDNPVSAVGDQIGRIGMARRIAERITESPAESSLRIGIFGAWGEGKTSVMYMVDEIVTSAGNHTVWLSPWTCKDERDFTRQFIAAVASELQIGDGLASLHAIGDATRSTRAVAAGDIKLAALNALVGAALEQKLASTVARKQLHFFEQVQAQLAGKKLVVFVDDLDRVPPERLASILMALRELTDSRDYPTWWALRRRL